MKLINLTPHAITIAMDIGKYEIQPSGEVARIERHNNPHLLITTDEGHRIRVETVRFGAIVGLPEPQTSTFYIVSPVVAHHANRRDVVYPSGILYVDDNVRECEGLLVPETAMNIQSGSNTAEILQLNEQGMKQKDIAIALGISPQAVSDALKRHRHSTTFTDSELCLIVDALNGKRHTDGIPYQFHLISSVVEALVIDPIDMKWDVNTETLSAKLNALTEAEAKALNGRVIAFWDAAPHTDMIAGLRGAGL